MSKYKAARKKSDAPVTPQMRPGLPCLVILIAAILATMVLFFLMMKNS